MSPQLARAMSRQVTCSAPVNIAVIKYWGKRDEELILPINSSLSASLDQAHLQTRTSAMVSTDFTEDRMWLNGKEESMSNPRLQNVLNAIRQRALERCSTEEDRALAKAHVHIVSENNFPTAAGLASSASGYACLVYTLAHLFGVADTELSALARVGSGSACRSMFGGWVKWEQGVCPKGTDSIAVQTHTESHWDDMQILILVVSDHKKGTSSTSGMGTSVATSELLKYRAEHVVPRRMEEIVKAISAKDFDTFGRITMQDSNQFHATCLDTYPPIFYMNDTSRAIVSMITQYNKQAGKVKAAYTYDAGPNAVIYAPAEAMKEVLSLAHHFFPPAESKKNEFYRGIVSSSPEPPSATLLEGVKLPIHEPGTLQYAILTRPGPGPQVLDASASLMGADGLPTAH